MQRKLASTSTADIKFSEIYAAELADYGLVQQYVPPVAGWCLLKNQGSEVGSLIYFCHHCYCILVCLYFQDTNAIFLFQMHRFRVHGVQISKTDWVSVVYTFGHADLHVCRTFVNQINACLKKELGRPKSLMVQ